MRTRIHGKESPLADILSDQFFFEISPYQRPYSWELEQAEELFEDLLMAALPLDEPVDALDPYFLGSVVLIKGDGSPSSQVVDGQQRLTTLTILLSAVRAVAPSLESGITKRLCEEGPLRDRRERFQTPNRDGGSIGETLESGGTDTMICRRHRHIRRICRHFSILSTH